MLTQKMRRLGIIPRLDGEDQTGYSGRSRVVRLWRPLLKKPEKPARVLMLVGPEECQGYLYQTGEKCGAAVEVPQPRMAFHLIHIQCRYEDVTPEEVTLDVDPSVKPRRKRAAMEAQDWFTKKLKRA